MCGKTSYLASLSSRRFLNSSEADERGPRLSGVWRVFRPQCCWSPARNEASDLQVIKIPVNGVAGVRICVKKVKDFEERYKGTIHSNYS